MPFSSGVLNFVLGKKCEKVYDCKYILRDYRLNLDTEDYQVVQGCNLRREFYRNLSHKIPELIRYYQFHAPNSGLQRYKIRPVSNIYSLKAAIRHQCWIREQALQYQTVPALRKGQQFLLWYFVRPEFNLMLDKMLH